MAQSNVILPKIIVGLGNPGRQYENTRHNIGFMILDRLAAYWGVTFKDDKNRQGMLAAGPGVLLVKPTTFMNESGRCVGAIARFYKIPPEAVFVIYDESAFPLGTFKLKGGGSAAGHNGIKSLIAHLGSQNFPRLRFGIGAPRGNADMVSHVLGSFPPFERELLDVTLAKATDAAICLKERGLDIAANLYNVNPNPKPKKEKKPKPVKVEETPSTEGAESGASTPTTEQGKATDEQGTETNL
jgi:PTH1 family peptidyl-tRNA hydrolase